MRCSWIDRATARNRDDVQCRTEAVTTLHDGTTVRPVCTVHEQAGLRVGWTEAPSNCNVCGRALVVQAGVYLVCPDTSDEHDEREHELRRLAGPDYSNEPGTMPGSGRRKR